MRKTSSNQLALFPTETPPRSFDEAMAEVSWSYSRRSTFEQCLRRYYYEHFSNQKGPSQDDQRMQTLGFLKQLQDRHLRTGKILHLVIRSFFQKAQEGDRWSAERLVNWARDMFQRDQTHSRLHPNGGGGFQGQYPPTLLREYHYGLHNADELCTEAEDRLIGDLYTFATNPAYEAFRVAGCSKGTLVEKRFKLVNFPCQVSGQIDLAYQASGGVTVVDWKLGFDDGSGNDSLQLAVYGLWAVSNFGCDPEDLLVYKAPLAAGTVVSFRADARILANAQARIEQDIERMAALEDYGKRGIEEVFTPCWQPSVCKGCPFERVCYA